MPIPGQSAVNPSPTNFMSRISTVSMSPGFAPRIWIGPVAAVHERQCDVGGRQLLSDMSDDPVVDVDRDLDSKVSPGSTVAI